MVDANPALTAKLEEQQNRTALFHNFSNFEFIGYWNGRARKFPAGAKMFMPLWQAEHYAKHLVNAILLKKGDEASVSSTSPKKPEDVPLFYDLFQKACVLQDEDGMTAEDSAIDIANRPQPKPEQPKAAAEDEKDVQIIHQGPADDEDNEANFDGAKE